MNFIPNGATPKHRWKAQHLNHRRSSVRNDQYRGVSQPVTCYNVACQHCQLCELGLDAHDSVDDRWLESIARSRRDLKRGDWLQRTGDPLRALYAIRFGALKTQVNTRDGQVQITAFHQAGDVIGLVDLVHGQHSTDIRALENTLLCEIPLEQIQSLTATLPHLHAQMLRSLSREIRHYHALSLLLGKKTAEERLAFFLTGLAQRSQLAKSSNSSGLTVRLPMSRVDIANHLGLVEETVCRTFTRFEQDGLLRNARRLIHVIDLPRLALLAAG